MSPGHFGQASPLFPVAPPRVECVPVAAD